MARATDKKEKRIVKMGKCSFKYSSNLNFYNFNYMYDYNINKKAMFLNHIASNNYFFSTISLSSLKIEFSGTTPLTLDNG